MRFNTVIFVLLLSFFCFTLAQVSYDDCCLKYVKKPYHRIHRHMVSYKHQDPDGGCNMKAIIFTMRKGRILCADPKEPWTIKLMARIDKKQTGKLGFGQPRRG